MHPMFVKLYLETSEDDLLAEQGEKRRAAVRAKRHQSRAAVRVVSPRAHDHQPRR